MVSRTGKAGPEQRDEPGDGGTAADHVCARLLDNLSILLTSGLPVDQIIARLVRQIAACDATVRVVHAGINERLELTILDAVDPPGMRAVRGLRSDLSKAPDYAGSLAGGLPRVIEDMSRAESLGPLAAMRRAAGVGAALDVPLRRDDRLVGLLCLEAPRPCRWTTHDVDTMMAVARFLSLALNDAHRASGPQSPETPAGTDEDASRQARKMEALGTLAGGIAHDFNNLLSSIIGYSELLLSRIESGDPRQRDAEEIRKAGERAASLTRHLLSFSRRQPLSPKVIDLNALVTESERMLRRLIGDNITLRTSLDPSLGRVKTDPGQIELAIINLAVNARDAMPRGGTITLETANCQLDEAYARNRPGVRPGPHVMLAVSDTGTGIDPAIRDHLFEPFFTTKAYGKGTGLGLSTVYGIVKQSRGNIWIYSESGRGSTFKIYLPRVLEKIRAVETGQDGAPMRPGTETVLVVDDEPAIRSLAREFLEMSGYTVLEAVDALHACRLGEEHPGAIDLMLTDVVMPRMSGPELAAHVAPRRPEMKILFMSGYTGDMIFNQGVLDVDKNFLQKPFGVEVLARKVREVLDQEDTRRTGRGSDIN